jgi:tRNA1(Val) A37 N6-methylase TrmN6
MHTNYHQPDFYRFSDDSIKLVNYVFEKQSLRHFNHVLDLCSGCGVVGIEFALRQRNLKRLSFCEVQDDFIPFIQKNSIELIPNVSISVHRNGYQHLHLEDKFDLVLCNPPYFYPGKGLLSPNESKNRCRFFIDSNLKELVLCIARHLDTNGVGYFLGRLNEDEFSIAQAALSVEFKFVQELDLGSCSIFSIKNQS